MDGALVDAEHVPFLGAYRYKPSGLATRAEWERTWSLQRQEDAVARRLCHDDVTHPDVREAIKKEIRRAWRRPGVRESFCLAR